MYLRQMVFVLLTSLAMLGGCKAREGTQKMASLLVDWKTLEFSCAHEADLLPKPDVEADEWYREANALFKAGVKANSYATLEQSFALLMRAAQRDHVKAMNNLVLAYLNGDGVKQSDAKAVEWAEELIKRNIGMGYYHMGVFLQQGIGVKQDRAAAVAYFRKSADLGNAQGQLVSGDKLLTAFAQTADRDRGYAIGTAMLRCALSQGLAEAGYELGHHFASMDAAEALKGFQAAARLGHNQSLYALYSIFRDGDYGQTKDQTRSSCYRRLYDELGEDKTKTFPNLDKICPLPPRPMPS